MFEKEAEEWEKEITDNADVEIHFGKPVKVMPTRKQSFQKGAEFGYNKANEWHYVKDGLPSEDDVYLIYTTKGVLLGHYEQGGADGETNFKGEPYSDFTEYPSEMLFTEDDVIAWKEIVLPGLPKEIK